MKKVVCQFGVLLFLLTGGLMACEPQDQKDVKPKSTKGARLESEAANSRFSYFFYVNGQQVARDGLFNVRSGQVFFVELRFSDNEVNPNIHVQMPVNTWTAPSGINLVKTWTPSINNANEYLVTAANILPGHQRGIGYLTANFSAFPSTSTAERQPVRIWLQQLSGGIEPGLVKPSGVYN